MINEAKSHKDFETRKGERRGKIDSSSRKSSSNTTTSSAKHGGFLQRTLLGNALREGVPEPEVFQEDLLLTGKTHHVFAGPGTGKSWTALWLAREAIERRQAVMYLDMENGQRTIAERLQYLSVDPAVVDEYLYYVSYPSLDMGYEDKARYAKTLGNYGPGLLIFDSWVGFLGAANLDENSNTDVEAWATSYVNPAKRMGWTTVLLDHVPHDASRSRGASRKKDLVDVQWRLENQQSFDRERMGRVQLKCEKDREGFLPERVAFSVGGTPEGFVFKRSDSTAAGKSDGLTESAHLAFSALTSMFGDNGARYGEWHRATPGTNGEQMPQRTFDKARALLVDKRCVRKEGNRYYPSNTAAAEAVDGQVPLHAPQQLLELLRCVQWMTILVKSCLREEYTVR